MTDLDQLEKDIEAYHWTDVASEELLRELVLRLRKSEKDAARYQHMRSSAAFRNMNGPGLYWFLPRFLKGESAEQLDQAVDAEINRRAKP